MCDNWGEEWSTFGRHGEEAVFALGDGELNVRDVSSEVTWGSHAEGEDGQLWLWQPGLRGRGSVGISGCVCRAVATSTEHNLW
jgi:hypothetical protein